MKVVTSVTAVKVPTYHIDLEMYSTVSPTQRDVP